MAGKAELVDRVAELTGYPKTQVAMTYDLLFELISEALAENDKVTVPNFGTFQISERPARAGRNPATGEAITIAASRSVRFKVSKNLKAMLWSRQLTISPSQQERQSAEGATDG